MVGNTDVYIYYALAFLGKDFIDGILETDEWEVDKLAGVGGFAHFYDQLAERGVLDCVVGEK